MTKVIMRTQQMMPLTKPGSKIIIVSIALIIMFFHMSCASLKNTRIIETKITVSSVFTTNMVLQRDKKVPVWGRAQPKKKVKVVFGDQEKTAEADKDGLWMLYLDPMQASSTPQDMVFDYSLNDGDIIAEDKNFAIVLHNIVVGDVWFCSGQSNMEYGMYGIYDRKNELKDVDYPEIRLFLISKNAYPFPRTRVRGSWEECSRSTITSGGWNGFSAVAFTFGRRLYNELDVPVGLIQSAFGGSKVNPWVPREELKNSPIFAKEYKTLVAADERYEKEKKKDKDAKHPFFGIVDYSRLKPATVYNAMVSPVIPFGIKGFLWYQGESNIGEGKTYTQKMEALISGWRRVFDQGDLPFYFVQLPPYNYGNNTKLPRMWEAQEACLEVPNTGMVTIIDVANMNDIHPKRKREVGERLALLALSKTYGREDIVYSGPVYKGMKVEGDTLVISFDYTGSGLVSGDGNPLTEFMISGDGKVFVPAVAVISGESVIVKSDKIQNPVVVRFAWSGDARPNLFNKEGLPARPFSTDSK